MAKQNAVSKTGIHLNKCTQYILIVLKVQAGYLESTHRWFHMENDQFAIKWFASTWYFKKKITKDAKHKCEESQAKLALPAMRWTCNSGQGRVESMRAMWQLGEKTKQKHTLLWCLPLHTDGFSPRNPTENRFDTGLVIWHITIVLKLGVSSVSCQRCEATLVKVHTCGNNLHVSKLGKRNTRTELKGLLAWRETCQTCVTVGYRFMAGRLWYLESTGYLDRRRLWDATFRLLVQAFYDVWLCGISTSPVSHSSLMNVLESWPAEACVIFPSFYHKEAAQLSCGIRSTLCRDRQTRSANKMECLCISHLPVNIQMPLPTGTQCVCVRAWKPGGGTQRTPLAW